MKYLMKSFAFCALLIVVVFIQQGCGQVPNNSLSMNNGGLGNGEPDEVSGVGPGILIPEGNYIHALLEPNCYLEIRIIANGSDKTQNFTHLDSCSENPEKRDLSMDSFTYNDQLNTLCFEENIYTFKKETLSDEDIESLNCIK